MENKRGYHIYSKEEWETQGMVSSESPAMTSAQKQVTMARGKDILVSAAAGSGKTWVLVKRILQRMKEEHINISEFLIVTFTKAAAAEMRERIGVAIQDALDELLEQQEQLASAGEQNLELEEEIAYFIRQTGLVYQAQICTIDSFCGDIVKQYFMKINIDPQYRIADEAELKILRGEVMERLLESYYEEASENFLTFVDCYAPGRDDKKIEELIETLYFFQMSHPDPEKWVHKSKELLNDKEVWYKEVLAHCVLLLEDLLKDVDFAYEYAKANGANDKILDVFLSDQLYFSSVKDACVAESYDDAYKRVAAHGKYATLNKKTMDADAGAYLAALRDAYKKNMKKLEETHFVYSYEQLERERKAVSSNMSVLFQLSTDFRILYEAEKRKKNMADFSDVEHMALHILNDIDGEGQFVPSEIALRMKAQYKEIMIDEYQDSNYLQETILSSFSDHNMFMVGDMKQSIYRFRMARPELFVGKYNTFYTYSDESQDALQVKIELDQNFRSSANVLEVTNYLFYHLMGASIGGVVYDDAASLKPGAQYPIPEFCEDDERIRQDPDGYYYDNDLELLLYDMQKGEETLDRTEESDDQEWDKVESEARMVAQKIQSMMQPGHRFLVKDNHLSGAAKEQYRPLEYRDIVILMRSPSSAANLFSKVLTDAGIPAYVESSVGYFSSPEVQIVLNYLRALINSTDDFVMASILRNYFGSLTPSEFAMITVAMRNCEYEGHQTLFQKVQKWLNMQDSNAGECKDHSLDVQGGKTDTLVEKLRRFMDFYLLCKKKAKDMTVAELIQFIYDCSGYYSFVSSMPAGTRRKANLDMLIQKARDYEKTNYRGLFQFVQYMNQLRTYDVDYGEANMLSENDNVVRIISIHKSKGLEYPVVFVSMLGKQFNEMDLKADVLLDADFGVGPNVIDSVLRTKHKTIMRDAITLKSKKDMLGEELRILYVALTRAKDKCILTSAVDHLKKKLEKVPYRTGCASIFRAKSYLDWILMSFGHHRAMHPIYQQYGLELLERDDHKYRTTQVQIHKYVAEDIGLFDEKDSVGREEILSELIEEAKQLDEERVRELNDRLSQNYAWEWATAQVGKYSVSQVKQYQLDYPEQEHADHEDLYDESDEGDANHTNAKNSVFVEKKSVKQLHPRTQDPIIPRFLQDSKDAVVLTSAQKGTYIHKFMELYDFTRRYTLEEFDRVADWMEIHGYDGIRQVFSPGKCKAFFESTLAKEMCAAADEDKLHKESQFVVGFPANEVLADLGVVIDQTEERILIQGIVDAYYELPDGSLVLLDYKTDRVQKMEVLQEKYTLQLSYYKKTLEQITGKKVDRCILYSFFLDEEIAI